MGLVLRWLCFDVSRETFCCRSIGEICKLLGSFIDWVFHVKQLASEATDWVVWIGLHRLCLKSVSRETLNWRLFGRRFCLLTVGSFFYEGCIPRFLCCQKEDVYTLLVTMGFVDWNDCFKLTNGRQSLCQCNLKFLCGQEVSVTPQFAFLGQALRRLFPFCLRRNKKNRMETKKSLRCCS